MTQSGRACDYTGGAPVNHERTLSHHPASTLPGRHPVRIRLVSLFSLMGWHHHQYMFYWPDHISNSRRGKVHAKRIRWRMGNLLQKFLAHDPVSLLTPLYQFIITFLCGNRFLCCVKTDPLFAAHFWCWNHSENGRTPGSQNKYREVWMQVHIHHIYKTYGLRK